MTRSEAIKALFFKSVLPVTVALILHCIFKSACVKNGELDYVWLLFTNERFWNISADAKMLYGILLDRMSLSAKYDTDCNTGANQSQTS